MVGTMKSETRKGFETIAEAARRLLAGMDRRADNSNRPAGESPAEIHDSPKEGPSSLGEKCRESERKRGEALHDSRQSTAYPAGGVTGGGFLIFNNDNRAVGVMASEAGVSVAMHPTATSADLYRHDFTERKSFRNRYARWGEW